METIGAILLIIAGAYVIGAIPWGVVLGRVIKGIDLRSYGSGGNRRDECLRVLGWRISVSVFLLDFSRVSSPVSSPAGSIADWAIARVAVATVVGHCWSPLHRLQGRQGHGHRRRGGGWLCRGCSLLPLIVAVVYLTRYVSLASMITAIVGPAIVVAMAIWGDFPGWWAAGVVGIATIIFVQHRGNINRLLHGSERKFGGRESPTANSHNPDDTTLAGTKGARTMWYGRLCV